VEIVSDAAPVLELALDMLDSNREPRTENVSGPIIALRDEGVEYAIATVSSSQRRELTRSARTGGCLCRRCCEKEAMPITTLHGRSSPLVSIVSGRVRAPVQIIVEDDHDALGQPPGPNDRFC
jgi:hypothetical protein